jgi:hypothetical protein
MGLLHRMLLETMSGSKIGDNLDILYAQPLSKCLQPAGPHGAPVGPLRQLHVRVYRETYM